MISFPAGASKSEDFGKRTSHSSHSSKTLGAYKRRERKSSREREYDFKIPENDDVFCYFSLCGDDGFAARVPAKSERGEEINLIISLLLFIQSIDVVAIVVVVRATTTEKNEKRRRFDNEHG
jgi:hypothetical protein